MWSPHLEEPARPVLILLAAVGPYIQNGGAIKCRKGVSKEKENMLTSCLIWSFLRIL